MPQEDAKPKEPKGFVMRPARQEDLDSIPSVVLASFAEEPEVNYRFPYRDAYPEDHLKGTREEYQRYLDQPEKFAFHVLEGSVVSDDKTVTQIVALAIWDVAVNLDSAEYNIDAGERRDANPKRYLAYAEAVKKRPKAFFSEFGEKQIYLSILMTHPNFRRRGAGTMLAQWGLNMAAERNCSITVCASPMGRLLYERLGFEEVAIETVQIDGDEEVLKTAVMVRRCVEAPKHTIEGSTWNWRCAVM